MAKLTGKFSMLLVFLSLVCLSPLPLASAGAPRIARTPRAHEEYRRQRQLDDIVGRGARPRVHTSEDSSAPITYGGGPVMTGNPSINVYIIYYGSWPAGSGQNIIENFIRSLSADSKQQGSPADPKVKRWWAISAAYTQEVDGTKKNVSSKVRLARTVYDKYSAGTDLDDGTDFGDTKVFEVISNKIGAGKALPYDASGIYLVLSSKDVTVPGFCTNYMGWHNMFYIGSKPVVFAFVGHHGQCKEEWIPKPSPNGNPAIDFTLSTIAHEVAEAATNPDVQTGWGDENGENADKCYMEVGQTKTGRDSRGGTYKYNLVGMKNMRFLIQSNWDWQKNMCVTQRKYQ
ncbi:unnamed protein product [Closterium sp. Yama58-4]|nr:unnamed protein product [Closterium sp. Yama58-4]